MKDLKIQDLLERNELLKGAGIQERVRGRKMRAGWSCLSVVICSFLEHESSRFSLRVSAAIPCLLNAVSPSNTSISGICGKLKRGERAFILKHQPNVENKKKNQDLV